MLRLLRRLGRRKKTTAGIKRATKRYKMEDHENAPPQPLDSTTFPPLGVEIHEITRTEAADRTQPTLPAEILIKKATIQTSVQNFQSQKTSIGLGDLRVNDWC